MKGLLYKDFIASNDRYYAIFAVLQFVLVIFFRIMMKSDAGTEVGAVYVFSIFLMYPIMLIFFMAETLLKNDSKKQITYIISTPITRKEYTKSKYIYIFIAFALISLIGILEYLLLKSGVKISNSKKLLNNIGKMIPIIIAGCMFIVAIELPLYFRLGVEKGKAIKEGLLLLVFFVFMGYVFFGDLDVFKNINLMKLLEMLIGEKKNMIYVQIGAPIVAVGAYVLSYFISKKISIERMLTDE